MVIESMSTMRCTPPYLGASEDGPHLLWPFFDEKMVIKPVDSGQTHQNPLMFRYQTHSAAPDLQTQPFLHQPPSRISSIAFGEAAWLVPVLSWLLCWCWLQLPWPYLWLHTWTSPDQMKFSPGRTSKREWIHPILSQGFYGDVRGIHPT